MENDCVRSLVRHTWLEAGSVSDGDMDVKTWKLSIWEGFFGFFNWLCWTSNFILNRGVKGMVHSWTTLTGLTDSVTDDPPVNVDIDVENPPIVDDFPDETIGFPQFFVCLPQGLFVSQISSSSAQQLGWDDENPGTESEDGPVVSFSKIQDPSGIKMNQVRLWKSWYYMTSWLVVWNIFYFPFHIWDNPSHLLSYVSEGLKPPTIYLLMIYTIWLWLR